MENRLDVTRSARTLAKFKVNYKYWKPSDNIKAPCQTMDFTCKKCGYVVKNEFVKAFFNRVKPCPGCKQKLAMEKQAKQLAAKQAMKAMHKINKPDLIALLNQLDNLDMRNVKWSEAPHKGVSHGEAWIKLFLDMLKLPYQQQKSYEDLLSPRGYKLRYDFLVAGHLLIEYDGRQHRHFSPHFCENDLSEFNYRKECDSIKNKYAISHGKALVRLKQTKPQALKNAFIRAIRKTFIK